MKDTALILRLQRISAFAPIAMSAAALAVVLASVALGTVTRQPDEGAAAHAFQLLLAAQVPLVAFFAWRTLPRDPARSVRVLAVQALAALIALAPVAWLGL